MNPPCNKCIYFVPTNYGPAGYCTIYVSFKGPKPFRVLEFSDKIRGDEDKCGAKGHLFEPREAPKNLSIL
jgi:hypothetical protein